MTTFYIDLPIEGGGGGGSDSFAIWQTPFGTAPTATSTMDTMTLTSSDDSLTITGNSSTDTINFQNAYKVCWRPACQGFDFSGAPPPSGGSTYSFLSYTAVNGDRVLFTNDNRVYVISGVGTSISWTLATDGQAGNGNPSPEDILPILRGTLFAGCFLSYSTGGGWNTTQTWSNGASISESAFGSGHLRFMSNAGISIAVNGLGWNAFTNNGISITSFTGSSFSGQNVYGVLSVTTNNITTNATPLFLTFMAGTDPSFFGMPANKVFKMQVDIVATRTDVTKSDALVGSYWQALYWDGAAFTAVGTTQTIGTPQSMGTVSGWTVDLTGTPGAVAVTGATGKTIQWGATATMVGSNS